MLHLTIGLGEEHSIVKTNKIRNGHNLLHPTNFLKISQDPYTNILI